MAYGIFLAIKILTVKIYIQYEIHAYKSKAFLKSVNVVLPLNKSIILVAPETDKESSVHRI